MHRYSALSYLNFNQIKLSFSRLYFCPFKGFRLLREINALLPCLSLTKTQLSLHILCTTLLSSPGALATIIDTTGSFPISLLAEVIKYHITKTNIQKQHHHREERYHNFHSTTPVEKNAELLNEQIK